MVACNDAEEIVPTHQSSTNLYRYIAYRDTYVDTNTRRAIDTRKFHSRRGIYYTSIIHQPKSKHRGHFILTDRYQHQPHQFVVKHSIPNKYCLLYNDPPSFLCATKTEVTVTAASAGVIETVLVSEQIPPHTRTPSSIDTIYHPRPRHCKQ